MMWKRNISNVPRKLLHMKISPKQNDEKFFIILGSFASLSLEIMVSIGENELGESSRIIQLLGEEGGQLANMKMQLQ